MTTKTTFVVQILASDDAIDYERPFDTEAEAIADLDHRIRREAVEQEGWTFQVVRREETILARSDGLPPLSEEQAKRRLQRDVDPETFMIFPADAETHQARLVEILRQHRQDG